MDNLSKEEIRKLTFGKFEESGEAEDEISEKAKQESVFEREPSKGKKQPVKAKKIPRNVRSHP